MESTVTLQDMLEIQCKILKQLQIETEILLCKNNTKDDLSNIHQLLLSVTSGFHKLKSYLNKMKEENARFQKLISMLKELDKKIVHMEKNVPQEMIDAYNEKVMPAVQNQTPSTNELVKCQSSSIRSSKNNYMQKNEDDDCRLVVKDCKKVLFNELETSPSIPLLAKKEFNEIPKYIICRHTLEALNNLICTINKVLQAKYALLALGKVGARKRGELDLYLHYKNEEYNLKEFGCTYFFTSEDYQRYTQMKIDKITLTLMIALRHCKRIRQHRVKKELYYIVL